jgi:hypothetical protein
MKKTMASRMTRSSLFVLVLMMSMPVHATTAASTPALQIKDEQRACHQDQDCQTIRTSCMSCCPDLSDSEAVNKKYAKDYEGLGSCTEAHIRSCGVPECGLESPAPNAVCRLGRCAVVMEYQGQITSRLEK